MMRQNNPRDFKKLVKDTIDIAKDLCYDDTVIKNLQTANNEAELEIIMNGARRRNG